MPRTYMRQGDCLGLMRTLPDASVDMILCDLPYGTTACKWDSVIPLPALWAEYERIIRRDGAIVLTAAQPFTTALAASNLKSFRYSIVWDKQFAANFVQAKRMPLRTHEDVLIFCPSGKSPRYFPQMTARDKPIKKGGNKQSEAIPIRQTKTAAAFGTSAKSYDEKHPISILTFSNRGVGDRGTHPTQKPVALMEYLIRTYTNEGDTVMDNCMGSGTTGVACMNTGRNFIGFELDQGYFQIARDRVLAAKRKLGLPNA